jgi:hypothetical protein
VTTIDRQHNHTGLVRFGLVLLFTLLSGGAATAATGSAAVNGTLHPGHNNVGTVTVTAADNTTSITGVTHSFPFNVSLTDTTANRTVNGTTFTSDVQADVPTDFPASQYTHKLFLSLPNETVAVPVTYTVAEVHNWTLNATRLRHNISVGSSGTFGVLELRQHGNEVDTVKFNVTGNLSEYVSVPRTQDAQPNNDRPVTVMYDVRKDVQFGRYSGQLVATAANRTHRVNLSSVFRDEIPPRIESILVEDMMATTDQTLYVNAADNLNVSTVTGRINRETTVEQGNETVTVNETVETVNLTHRTRTTTWKTVFDESAEIGRYYLAVAVVDGSGNRVNATTGFDVEGLNASHVVASNFQFRDAKPYDAEHQDRAARRTVLQNDIETPVTFTLTSFEHDDGNSSIDVGILEPGDEEMSEFDLSVDDPQLTVEDAGEYQLVVRSDKVETFNGNINVTPVPQHYPVPSIRFRGGFVNPEYPPFGQYSIGTMNGSIEPVRNDHGLTTGVRLELQQYDISDCKNVAKWNQCIPGFDLGEIREANKSEAQAWNVAETAQANERTAYMVAGGVVLVVILAGYVFYQLVRKRDIMRAYIPREVDRT